MAKSRTYPSIESQEGFALSSVEECDGREGFATLLMTAASALKSGLE